MENFERSKLWKATLAVQTQDENAEFRERLRQSYIDFRRRTAEVLKHIVTDAPDLTVHDLTHVDALWELADLFLGRSVGTFTPVEGYLLGGSFLLHDAALSVVTFKGGMAELRETPEWSDAVVAGLIARDMPTNDQMIESPPPELAREALLETLRIYHARQAAELPGMAWIKPGSTEQLWLIQDEELRGYYGQIIGLLAQSHWTDVWELSSKLPSLVTPGPGLPSEWIACPLKLACLLRVSDAAHLDHRRAPSLLMALRRPSASSIKYWTFQNKLGKPSSQDDAVVFSSGAFNIDEADSWWECLRALRVLDLELKHVDAVLQDRNLERFPLRRVSGVESLDTLRRLILTKGWTPVDTALKVTDVQRIISMFGGRRLYGDDPLVPIRELIQNAADAIRAKQVLRDLPISSGVISVKLRQADDGWWLDVTDDGIGMSSRVLTQVLLDFGSRFWTGPLIREELPGLLGKGMRARGGFGIGFFSVFMLGSKVRITSWKDGSAAQDMCTLEFRGGLGSRPILREPEASESLVCPGTRVSVRLLVAPTDQGGILWGGKDWLGNPITRDFGIVVASLAPTLDISLEVVAGAERHRAVRGGDWIEVDDSALLKRISKGSLQATEPILRPLQDEKGDIYGRAALDLELLSYREKCVVTVEGLRVCSVHYMIGVLVGSASATLARDAAFPSVPISVLSSWASDQAVIILELSNSRQLDRSHSNNDVLMRIAALVLKCGGNIGELPLVHSGESCLSVNQFKSFLKQGDEFRLLVGEANYDEDLDDMHPREFKDNFVYSSDLLRILNDDPVMLNIGGKIWPDFLLEDTGKPRTLQEMIWSATKTTWGEFQTSEEECKVGTVNSTSVVREVLVVRRDLKVPTMTPPNL